MTTVPLTHDVEAEQSVLGACLLDDSLIDQARQLVAAEDFFRADHRLIFARMVQMRDAGKAVDIVTLSAAVEPDGVARSYLAQLSGSCPASGHVQAYAGLVAEQARRRAITRAGHELSASAADPAIDLSSTESKLLDISAALAERRGQFEAKFDQVGLGYRSEVPSLGLEFLIDRLRESRAELSGELTVRARRAGVSGHLLRGRFNLSSIATRRSWAKELAEKMAGLRVPWDRLLEDFCLRVLEAERRGTDLETVGRRAIGSTSLPLLDPLLPSGSATIIFGPGGSGKSTLAAAIAVSIATGAEVVPGWHPISAPVLILDWEADAAEWNERIAVVAAGANIEAPEILYHRCARPIDDMVEQVAAEVAERGVGLVIVDSVTAACGATRDGAPSSEASTRLFEALRLLGTTSLLIDHVAGVELENKRATAKPYGDVHKLNRARSVFELRREKDLVDGDVELLILHTKVNSGPRLPPRGLRIHYGQNQAGNLIAIRFLTADIEAPDLVDRLPDRERVVRLLARGALTPTQIADELGIPAGSVRTYLARLGPKVRRNADGKYGLSA